MSLEKIGRLAVELHAATLARKGAKYDLRDKYTEFCTECLAMSGFTYIDKAHQQYRAMQEFAKHEVDAYRRAQLNEYNLKRKLDRAIRSPKKDPTELESFAARTEKAISGFLYGPEAGNEESLHDLLVAAIELAPAKNNPMDLDLAASTQIDMAEVWGAGQ